MSWLNFLSCLSLDFDTDWQSNFVHNLRISVLNYGLSVHLDVDSMIKVHGISKYSECLKYVLSKLWLAQFGC